MNGAGWRAGRGAGREQDQIRRLRQVAAGASLDPVFVEKFLAFVIAEVIRHHEVIARS